MSPIPGANNLPDFSGIRPFVDASDLAPLDQAIKEFESRLAEFKTASDTAKKTVAVTLGWVGVGEKVVALLNVIVQKRLQGGSAAAPEQGRLTELQDRLSQFAALFPSLRTALPGLWA